MRSLESWIAEYRESHRHPVNQTIHLVCVPLITFATLGLLAAIPVPSSIRPLPYFNWASAVAAICLVYYASLDLRDAAGMLIAVLVDLAIVALLRRAGILLPVAGAIFTLAWIVQIYGHRVEGRSPSFLKNAVFFLIGPIWVHRKFVNGLVGSKSSV